MTIIYALAAVLATLLAPLVGLRIWNEGARWMRKRSARRLMGVSTLALAASLAACGQGAHTGASGGTGGDTSDAGGCTCCITGAMPGPNVTCCDPPCGADAGGDASSCDLARPNCPAGSFNICDFASFLATCCDGTKAVNACARAAGALTHSCAATCDTGLCAVSANGVETCCSNSGSDDACSKAVP